MSVFYQDLHASDSFHSTRPYYSVLQCDDGFYQLKSTSLYGYTHVVSIDEVACHIVYRLVVCIDIE